MYFCWVQPPKTKESIDEESVWVKKESNNSREVTGIIAMVMVFSRKERDWIEIERGGL